MSVAPPLDRPDGSDPEGRDPDGPDPDGPAPEGPSRSTRRRPVLYAALAVGLVFAVFSALLATRIGKNPEYTPTALLGRPAPDLTLPTLDGRSLALARQPGRVVLVNFFNSWCVPCNEERPALQAFYARHRRDPDFLMVGIIRDDTDRAVRKWVARWKIGWTIARDPGSRASLDFGTTGQPETYAIGPDGTIVAKQLGRATAKDLEAMLALARGEARP